MYFDDKLDALVSLFAVLSLLCAVTNCVVMKCIQTQAS